MAQRFLILSVYNACNSLYRKIFKRLVIITLILKRNLLIYVLTDFER